MCCGEYPRLWTALYNNSRLHFLLFDIEQSLNHTFSGQSLVQSSIAIRFLSKYVFGGYLC